MRCVCSYWNALLSEPKFVKSHLDSSIHNEEEILLFYKRGFTFGSNPGPLATRASGSLDTEVTNLMKFKLPVDPQHKKASGYIVGSVNGLLCYFYLSNKDLVIRIWNPSLSALLTLLPSNLFHKSTHFGFGNDPKNDDYKVVRIPCFVRNSNTQPPQGEVYSVRKGSWETIHERVPSNIKEFNSLLNVCVDGRLHWTCFTDLQQKADMIMTFDLGEMTYGQMPLPDSSIDDCFNSLGVLGGKLFVISIIDGCECHVWVVGDDGSWVKLHVFSQFKCFITPYGFTSRNQFLFQADDGPRFILHDPIAATTTPFEIKLMIRKFLTYKLFNYVDSLVWIAPPAHSKLALSLG